MELENTPSSVMSVIPDISPRVMNRLIKKYIRKEEMDKSLSVKLTGYITIPTGDHTEPDEFEWELTINGII